MQHFSIDEDLARELSGLPPSGVAVVLEEGQTHGAALLDEFADCAQEHFAEQDGDADTRGVAEHVRADLRRIAAQAAE